MESAARGPSTLATAGALDGEMAERIRRHRARRGARWTTREEPLDVAAALSEVATPERPVLVDCLTLWLAKPLLAGRDVDEAAAGLLEALPRLGRAGGVA